VGGEKDMAFFIGLDIGGTKLAAGLVNMHGEVFARQRVPTHATGTAEALFADTVKLVDTLLAQHKRGTGAFSEKRRATILGIGVGCGGPMIASGVSPLNIPAWRDFPLQDRLSTHFQQDVTVDLAGDVTVDNDAKAFTLGEGWTGAARGVENYLGVVVSTGVGGGIVLDRRLLHGQAGNAGHIGHIIVSPPGEMCGCGAQGCLEAEASGTAIARKAVQRLENGEGRGSVLREIWEERTAAAAFPDRSLSSVHGFTARDVAMASRAGDALALQVFQQAGEALGRGIASVANLLDLRMAVVGGGVCATGDLLLAPARAEAKRRARIAHARPLEIVAALLGEDAGIVGAAALAMIAAGVGSAAAFFGSGAARVVS